MSHSLFDVSNKTAVITGGSGVLGGAMAKGLAQAGARVAVLGRRLEACEAIAQDIHARGGEAIGVSTDVLQRDSLEQAASKIERAFGAVDILINAAGGNQPGGTTSATQSFFQLDAEAVSNVFSLNFMGTFLTCQVFGMGMAQRKQGVIVNVTSMSALRPLTRVAAYSAAKAALSNFTQWLAVHMAQEYGPQLRVNALAPGFFLTEQNRFLLTDKDSGAWTERGSKIVAHTPLGRLGEAQDLIGTLLWLVSAASEYVTGIVVPVDGGFSAYSGV